MTAPPTILRTDTGYRPRPLQQTLHRSLRRFSVVVCHRRFGKTTLGVNALIDAALRLKAPEGRYAYLAPYAVQAKDIAWSLLRRHALPVQRTETHETELRVDFANGSRVRLYGADHPDRLRGLAFDGVVFDECADLERRVWPEIVRPALADREGWALFIGTPKGKDVFHDLFQYAEKEMATSGDTWFAARMPASGSGVLGAAELRSIKDQLTEDEYAQEFECSFDAAPAGTYYAKEIALAEAERRVGRVPWDPAVPVHTAWDLGIDDATAIWFCQRVGAEVRVIDYYAASGEALPHYARHLADKPYVYGEHHLPPDAEARELGTGHTRIETLAALGFRGRVVPRLSIEDGIHAARLLLRRCWFDAERCAAGIKALRAYRREWNQRMGVFQAAPRHDWSSHAADAFRYLAVGLTAERRVPGRPEIATVAGYDPFRW